MKTLMEFKKDYREWAFITECWIKNNSIPCNPNDLTLKPENEILFNRPITVSDIIGLTANAAYSVYKDFQPKENQEELINEEHLLFINFLKQQGITADFSYTLKQHKRLSTEEYLNGLDTKKIDLEYAIFMAFKWDLVEGHKEFWLYHSNLWKEKLNNFRR